MRVLNKQRQHMNKIRILQNEVQFDEQDSSLHVETTIPTSPFEILKIKILVDQSAYLEIYQESQEESKMNIVFEISQNVSFHILEICKSSKLKIKYEYNLDAYSDVTVTKFYDCDHVKELDLIQLNGEYASINHHLKTITKEKQRFDLVTYHNAAHTESHMLNHGVNIKEGSIDFQVTSIVYQGIKGCTLNQNNRIITMNDQKCNIEPILLIEEEDVVANHSAHIGQFDKEQLFYIMSRGIREDKALQLLIKGFLLESVSETDSIQKIIEQYWG